MFPTTFKQDRILFQTEHSQSKVKHVLIKHLKLKLSVPVVKLPKFINLVVNYRGFLLHVQKHTVCCHEMLSQRARVRFKLMQNFESFSTKFKQLFSTTLSLKMGSVCDLVSKKRKQVKKQLTNVSSAGNMRSLPFLGTQNL